MSSRSNRGQLTESKNGCNTMDASVLQQLLIIPEHPRLLWGQCCSICSFEFFVDHYLSFVIFPGSNCIVSPSIYGLPFGIFKLCVINIVLSDDRLIHSNNDKNTQRCTNTRKYTRLCFSKRKCDSLKRKLIQSQRAIILA